MSKPGDYESVKQDILKLMHLPGYDDGHIGPVIVRLAWHHAGTFDKETGTGGSSGAGMRYEKEGGDPANAGLQHARKFLEPVKEKHPWLSYSDLWTLAGCVAVESMGGPKIKWEPGRTDFTDDSKCPPRGRLPDAAQGADHIRHIFYRMGFNDQEIVALSGAHNLGRCHADRSGFSGPWVNNPTKFSNQYFKLLRSLEWKPKKWNGPLQYADEDDKLMMLPTDIALIKDEKFIKYVEIYAKDQAKFFEDFAAVFAKLMELGVRRDGKDPTNEGKSDNKTPEQAKSGDVPKAAPQKPVTAQAEKARSKL